MTNNPLPAALASIKRYAQWTDGSLRSADDGDLCHYTEAAERIEKLEREIFGVLKNIPNSVRVREGGADENIAASLAVSVAMLVQERDTALRALAEARRDAERYRFLRDLESPFRIYLDNERLETLWAHTLDEAVDAASQPEKDANHG